MLRDRPANDGAVRSGSKEAAIAPGTRGDPLMVLRTVFCVAVGLLALLGLFLAAGAQESAMYEAGLIMALFSVLFIFWQIKRGYDRAEKSGSGHRPAGGETAR